jgi:hypothetical protein
MFAFVSPYVKYNFAYAAVRFEWRLLNRERCKGCQRFKRFSHREEKADHVWRGAQWQLASGAWVCGTQRRCASAKTFHFVASAASLAAASPHREVAAVIRRCHNSTLNCRNGRDICHPSRIICGRY